MARLPLDGIRVCDLSVVWAGPYCCQILADWGAEVVRVESRHFFTTWDRGTTSLMTPTEMIQAMRFNAHYLYMYADADPGDDPWNRYNVFNCHARNKLSMTLEFSTPLGKEILGRLIKASDIVVENRPVGQLDKWGISYEWAKELKSDIIYIRMPPFGLSGPYSGVSILGPNIDMICGHALLRAYPDRSYEDIPVNHYTDATGGRNAALAALMALHYRDRTGKGQMVEVAQVETLLAMMPEAVMDYTMNQRVQESIGNRHLCFAPCGVYRCKGEDQWIAITVTSDEEWQGLCHTMGDPEWAGDERFADPLSRYQNQDEMDTLIEEWTIQHDHYALMYLLQREGVPAGAVTDDAERYSDPHLRERDFFNELTQEGVGTHLHPGLMWKMSKTPNRLRLPPCRLGEHNEHVYKKILGVSDEEYAELEKAGHIGTTFDLGAPFEG